MGAGGEGGGGLNPKVCAPKMAGQISPVVHVVASHDGHFGLGGGGGPPSLGF